MDKYLIRLERKEKGMKFIMFNNFRCCMCKRDMNRGPETDDITQEQLNDFIQRGAILIDVRSPQEYDEGHLPYSICVPDYEILYRINSIIINKEQEIVLYCISGSRSKVVQRKLQKMGYRNVYNLYKRNYKLMFL